MNDIETIVDGKLQLEFECTLGDFADNKYTFKAADLYVFRNGEDIFYIGISSCAVTRFYNHILGNPKDAGQVHLRQWAVDNKPASLSWVVQFYRLCRCDVSRRTCVLNEPKDERSIDHQSLCWRCLEAVEGALIRTINPTLNKYGRTGAATLKGQYKDWREMYSIVEVDLEI